MPARTFYRLSLWLPIVLPLAVAVAVNGLRLGVYVREPPFAKIVQLMLISLVYGGIPYTILALWGTWWIDHRREPEIRRRALLAPLLMIAAWIPFAMIPSVMAREIRMFFGLVAFGAVYAIVLGYAYVAVVFALRALFGRAGWITETAPSRPVP
jgi:hypothetical protein